jgi:hypothetical protein
MMPTGLGSRTYIYNTAVLPCGANEEVIGLDVPIDEGLFVDGLDAGNLGGFGVNMQV